MTFALARALLLVVGLLAAVCRGRAADRIAGFDVDGDILRVRFASGAVMSGRDLVGATLTIAQADGAFLKVKVESVEN
jgi:hypothetical protein